MHWSRLRGAATHVRWLISAQAPCNQAIPLLLLSLFTTLLQAGWLHWCGGD